MRRLSRSGMACSVCNSQECPRCAHASRTPTPSRPSRFKPSWPRRVAQKPLCRGEGPKQPGFLNLPCLYSTLCRAPQRMGALRCSRTVCRMDRAVPNTEAFKACIQHDATRALEGHFLWVTFLLGQQKKSDSSVGRRSKRPPRRRQPGGNIATEGQEPQTGLIGKTNLRGAG
jgi:hypothetical protein